jgi:cytochrome c oxidase subunit 2
VRPLGRRLPTTARVLLIGALLVVLPGCAPEGFSTQGRDIQTFYNVVFFLAVVIFAGVNIALIYFVTKYRRKPTDVAMPPQIHGSTAAEITWTVIPSLIVFGLFGMSWASIRSVDRKAKTPGVVVEVQGYQWQWQFNYGNGLVVKQDPKKPTEPPTMYIPINEPVRFILTSDNVIHAFFVPKFLFKRDVVPGRQNEFDITVDTPGTYKGQCAEFCGKDHAAMNFVVKAINRKAFDEWAAKTKLESCSGEPDNDGVLEVNTPAGQIAFDTSCLVAPAGQEVTLKYTNGGGNLHNVAVSKSADDLKPIALSGPPFPSGTQEGKIPALEKGQYYFYCTVHPGMNGTYKVQ